MKTEKAKEQESVDNHEANSSNESVEPTTEPSTDEVTASTDSLPEVEPVVAATPDTENTPETSEIEPNSEESKDAIDSSDEIEVEVINVETAPSAEQKGEVLSDALGDENHSSVNEEQHELTENSEEEEEEVIDFSVLSKDEIFKILDEVNKKGPGAIRSNQIADAHKAFVAIYSKEKKDAFAKFEEEGGTREDFAYKGEDIDTKFFAVYDKLIGDLSKYKADINEQKRINLTKKSEILERLRDLVDGEESTTSINKIKEVQEEWKSVGPVPSDSNKELWANYHALLDRFYNNRSIFFELKELDRKKNLTVKQELCDKAEQLDSMESIKDALVELNKLHHEYKIVGPVPQEEQEELWSRFKAASDKIYQKRKEYFAVVKEEQTGNLQLKEEILAKIIELSDFQTQNIGEWKAKTNELRQLEAQWKEIRNIPFDKIKDLNKAFWKGVKQFYSNKRAYYKSQEADIDEKIEQKKVLVEKAEALKESEDFDSAQKEIKDLQFQWKNIKHIPTKKDKDLYKRFKESCDTFFNRKRNHMKEMDKVYVDNLKVKQALLLEKESLCTKNEMSIEDVEALVAEWDAIGFVPFENKGEINDSFSSMCGAIIESSTAIDNAEKEKVKLQIKVKVVGGSSKGKNVLAKDENSIKKKINQLENDIRVWTTNKEFFNLSSKSSSLLDDFDKKISDAEKELVTLKERLKIIRSV